MKHFDKNLRNRLVKSLIVMTGMLLSISMYGQLVPYTPYENAFNVDNYENGDEYFQYILLDEGTSSSSKFFVLTRDHYNRNRAFNASPGQKFDPTITDCIAYFLNSEEFRTIGNGPNPTGKRAFSPTVWNYIDKNHEWETEAGSPGSNAPEPYTITCGIVFLSQTEWFQYAPKIGYADDMQNFGWYLRTGNPADATQVLAVNVEDGTLEGRSRGGQSYYLRPAFYLNDSFFKEVRLNIVTVGDNVREILRKNYTREDLSGIYSEEELTELGFAPASIINVTKESGINISNQAAGEFRLTGAENYTLQVFSVDGKIVHTQKLVSSDETISLKKLPAGIYFFRLNKAGNTKTLKVVKQ